MTRFNASVYLCALMLLFVIFFSCETADRESDSTAGESGIFSSPVQIGWELVSNLEPDNWFSATLRFTNNGSETLAGEGWALYFNSIRLLDPDSFLPDFEATHINGDFFRLTPAAAFTPIEPGETREFGYKARYFSIKKTDAPQGFYFVFDDGRIENVDTVDVAPFTRPQQVNRTGNDRLPVPTPETIYEQNESISALDASQVGKIIPTPAHIEYSDEKYRFSSGVRVFHHDLLINEAGFLTERLNNHFELASSAQISSDSTEEEGIYLKLDRTSDKGPEEYILEVNPDRIIISATDSPGIFYGIQSLLALLHNRDGEDLEINMVRIEDAPAFEYRGMHLDVSRNFQRVDYVRRLLDVMAMYKLNKFHFHLTDDEGWRLEIEALPELTEVGGRRGHTEDESGFLIPSYGSGPDPTPGSSKGSGWYTKQEYVELLRYATERHIEVIPEIDVPGHARAAIIAMKARSARLAEAGNTEEANEFRLDEEEDRSTYLSIQNFDDNVINVCLESTYRFMEVVIDEIAEMHRMASAPLRAIHMGGDEVPRGVWEDSPACNRLMEEEGISNVRDLQGYFFGRVLAKLQNRNLNMAGWEEVVFLEDPETDEHIPNPDFAGQVQPHVWSNIWGSGTEDYAYKLANMGYKVIMSHASSFYFDMAYNKHWQEPGFYWANMFGSKEPYSFIPFNLYKNAVRDSQGRPIDDDYFEGAVQLSQEGRDNIRGIQGQLWAETVNRPDRMDYMILPRLQALAERAWVGDAEWSQADDRNEMWRQRDIAWNEFANRIGRFELKRLDRLYPGINYRLPPPGAIIDGGLLVANQALPGLEIRYAINGDELTEESPLYDGPLPLSGVDSVTLATFNSLGRASRPVQLFISGNN